MEVLIGEPAESDMDVFLADLQEIGRRHGCLVQVIDGKYVVDETHLSEAVRLARRAEQRGTMIADDPAMEVLLYAAATRQIERAIQIGIDGDTETVVIVIDGADEDTAIATIESHLDSVLEDYVPETRVIREWFEISDAEERVTEASLSDLVCERVTLLQLEA